MTRIPPLPLAPYSRPNRKIGTAPLPAIRFASESDEAGFAELVKTISELNSHSSGLSNEAFRTQYNTRINALKSLSSTEKVALRSIPPKAQKVYCDDIGFFTKGLHKALRQITHDGVRSAWVKALFRYSDRDLWVNQAAARAIPLIANAEERDGLIKELCSHYDVPLRKTGVKLIPYISNPELRQNLYENALSDDKAAIRRRAKLLGKSPWVRSLFGFMLRGLVQPGNTPAKAIPQPLSPLVQAGVITRPDAAPHPIQQLDPLADAMAGQLQELFASTPEAREALIAQYGSEKALPNAADLKKHFYTLASQHLQGQQKGLKRLLHSSPNAQDVVNLAQMLMEVAMESGYYNHLNLEKMDVPLFKQIHEQRSKLNGDLEQARKLHAQQVLVLTQANQALKRQQTQVARLVIILKEPGNSIEAQQARNSKQLFHERCLLKQLEERVSVCQASVNLAETKVDSIQDNLNRLKESLGNALQFNLLQNTQEELSKLDRESETTLTRHLQSDPLQAFQDKKYHILAEHQMQIEKPQPGKTTTTSE